MNEITPNPNLKQAYDWLQNIKDLGVTDTAIINSVEQGQIELEAVNSRIQATERDLEQLREVHKKYGLYIDAALRGDKRNDEPENQGRLDAIRNLAATADLHAFVNFIESKEAPVFEESKIPAGESIITINELRAYVDSFKAQL